jgi:hypothetical protein
MAHQWAWKLWAFDRSSYSFADGTVIVRKVKPERIGRK